MTSMQDRFPGLQQQTSSALPQPVVVLPDIEAILKQRKLEQEQREREQQQQQHKPSLSSSSLSSPTTASPSSPSSSIGEPSGASSSSSSSPSYNHSKYIQPIKSGLDVRTTPYAGVVAPDVVDTEAQDDPEDKLPPLEQGAFMGMVPASLVQMSLTQQMWRIPFFFLLCIAIQCFVLNFTTIRMPDPKTQLQLPDLGFELLPRNRDLEQVTALLLLSMNILGGVTIIGLWRVATYRQAPSQHPYVRGLTPRRYLHKIAWIRWWGSFAIASFLRAIVIIMTTLPSTNNQCKVRPTIDNIWLNTLKGIYSLGASNIHCGDLLFSGHTTAMFLDFMTVWTYGPILSSYLRPLVVLITGSAFMTMLSSRAHYSDDIIVAVIVMYSTYTLFGHNAKSGAPLWVQGLLRPINTIMNFRGKSALPAQSSSPLVPEINTNSNNNNNNNNNMNEHAGETSNKPVAISIDGGDHNGNSNNHDDNDTFIHHKSYGNSSINEKIFSSSVSNDSSSGRNSNDNNNNHHHHHHHHQGDYNTNTNHHLHRHSRSFSSSSSIVELDSRDSFGEQDGDTLTLAAAHDQQQNRTINNNNTSNNNSDRSSFSTSVDASQQQ